MLLRDVVLEVLNLFREERREVYGLFVMRSQTHGL